MIDNKQIKSIVGNVVKELRLQKDITQEQLAEYLGLQMQTITRIETGKSFISSEVLANLCNFFNVEPTIFFSKKSGILTDKDKNYISEIKRLLPEFSSEKLREIYKILLALDK